MDEKQLDKLEKVITLIDTDYVTAEDFSESLVVLIEQLKKLDDEGDEKIQNLASSISSEIVKIQAKIIKQGEVSSTNDKKLSDAISRVKEDIKDVVKDLKDRIYGIKLRKGEDGKDGKQGPKGDKGDNGSPDEPKDIKKKLESLKGEDRLDAKAIKNLPNATREIIREVGGFRAGAMETPLRDLATGQILPKDAFGAWLINQNGGASGVTDVTATSPLQSSGSTTPNISFIDPNNNGILGWDDIDGSASFWSLGTSLSYDHATHTLSANQNLQQVTDAGNTTTNAIVVGTGAAVLNSHGENTVFGFDAGSVAANVGNTFFGYQAGKGNTSDGVTIFGELSGLNNSAADVVSIGSASLNNNTGYQVYSLGDGNGDSNTFNNIVLLGTNATATASKQLSFGVYDAGTSVVARFNFGGLTADREYDLQDANGTLALTSNLSSWLTGTLTGNVTLNLNANTLKFVGGGLVFGTGTAGSGNAAFGSDNTVNDGIAQGASFAFGEAQTIVGEASTALYGFGNNVVDANDALVGGTGSNVFATGAIALGVAANANNIESIALGSNNSTNGDYAIVAGGLSNGASGLHSGAFAGTANAANGINSVVLGGTGITGNADNTAYVPSLSVTGATSLNLVTVSSFPYSVSDTDTTVLGDNSGGGSAGVVQLPAASSFANRVIVVKTIQAGTGGISVTSAGGQVESGASHSLPLRGNAAIFQSDGTDWWIISNF